MKQRVRETLEKTLKVGGWLNQEFSDVRTPHGNESNDRDLINAIRPAG